MVESRPPAGGQPRHLGRSRRERQEADDAYFIARGEVSGISTIRLRFAERRARANIGRLDQLDRARLAAIRDELRFRGVEVPDL